MDRLNPSLIVQPKKKTQARITIEVDIQGRTEVKAVLLAGGDIPGQPEVEFPMHQSAKASLLGQVLAAVLITWNQETVKQEKGIINGSEAKQ